MKANKDDRLYTVKPKKRVNWYLLSLLAALIAGGLFYLTENPTEKPTIKERNMPGATKQLLKDSKPGATKELLESPFRETESTEKQTVFNDQNYQPKGSINTIAPPPSRYYEQGQARTNAQIRELQRSFNGVNNTRSIPWSWKSQKSHHSGTFTYVERSGRIYTPSVCANYKYGSLIYRDCRKAAKKYFKDACSSQFKAACGAADMIP